MSNARLKEQIEAAKIALVHSEELAEPLETNRQTDTVAQTVNRNVDHVVSDNLGNKARPELNATDATQTLGQKCIPQSDFEILEARLKELEEQIKSQQRDLHTLLQKLRDITAKSKIAAKSDSNKGKARSAVAFGFLLFSAGLALAYYMLGADIILAAVYQGTSWMVGLIDMLSTQL